MLVRIAFLPGAHCKIVVISNGIWHLDTLGAWPCKFRFQFLKSVERDRTNGNILDHAYQPGCEFRLF